VPRKIVGDATFIVVSYSIIPPFYWVEASGEAWSIIPMRRQADMANI
jgi:hypothetical protein